MKKTKIGISKTRKSTKNILQIENLDIPGHSISAISITFITSQLDASFQSTREKLAFSIEKGLPQQPGALKKTVSILYYLQNKLQ